MTDTPEAVSLADQIHAGNGEWMPLPAAPTPPNADQKGQ